MYHLVLVRVLFQMSACSVAIALNVTGRSFAIAPDVTSDIVTVDIRSTFAPKLASLLSILNDTTPPVPASDPVTLNNKSFNGA